MYWLLTFIPEILIYLTVLVGFIGIVVALFMTKIPIINTYRLPLQLVSILLISFGLYLSGAIAYKNSIAVEVADLKTRLAQAETKSAKINTVIVEKIVKDTQVIRQKGNTITEYIDREVPKYDNTCTIPKEVIKAHNMAATLKTDELAGENK